MKQIAAILVLCMVANVSMARKKPKGPVPEVAPQLVEKLTAAVPDKPTVKPKQKRKLLVFHRCDGFYHGCIPVGVKLFKIMGEKTGAFETVVDYKLEAFSDENLKQFDAICFMNTTRLKMTEDQQAALMKFVKSGKGIVGIHGASDNFHNWPEGAQMMGGVFAGHPWGAGGTWAIKLDEADHPLNKAFAGQGFQIKDEIYEIKGPYSRDTHRVLLSLDLTDKATGSRKGKRQDKDFAVAWIKRHEAGRIFYCSLGHNISVFHTPAVVQHYLDGTQYALGDYEMDDKPSSAAK